MTNLIRYRIALPGKLYASSPLTTTTANPALAACIGGKAEADSIARQLGGTAEAFELIVPAASTPESRFAERVAARRAARGDKR